VIHMVYSKQIAEIEKRHYFFILPGTFQEKKGHFTQYFMQMKLSDGLKTPLVTLIQVDRLIYYGAVPVPPPKLAIHQNKIKYKVFKKVYKDGEVPSSNTGSMFELVTKIQKKAPYTGEFYHFDCLKFSWFNDKDGF
jgi:hypothetical protein